MWKTKEFRAGNRIDNQINNFLEENKIKHWSVAGYQVMKSPRSNEVLSNVLIQYEELDK
ncbi:hypothetical protein [Staphylococcus capitis]|uniref:Phage protein n=1 Tax=Staphylococcus capitis TaxID=29388 RepID=A0ABX1ST01_STACP|nr:hypothetical protein [Staphylococcus capitis]NMK54023.1 hypothetical protein [Staphylococcus capitis]NMK69285.1 hypothetical protein [Staphylococcus capitis]